MPPAIGTAMRRMTSEPVPAYSANPRGYFRLVWLWLAEGQRPDRWDLVGSAICVLGASIILLAPRSTSIS